MKISGAFNRRKQEKLLLDVLNRLVEAAKAGNFHFSFNLEGLSHDEAEIVRLISEAVDYYQAASEHNLMKYKSTFESLGIGLWDMEVVDGDPVNPDNKIIWSQEFRQKLGFDSERDFPNVLGSWINRLHPDDIERAISAVVAHLNDHTGKTPFDIEYRLMRKNGGYRHIHAFGSTIRDGAGVPLRMTGALMDIDEKKLMKAIEHQDALLHVVNQAAVFLLNADVDSFKRALHLSINLIAEALTVDRVYLWKNHMSDRGLQCSRVFEWSPEETLFAESASFNYSADLPGWEDRLANGHYINSPVREMSQIVREKLSQAGILSIMVAPIFINDQFWGFVGFDNRRQERVFSKEETPVLYSASMIIANSYIRNEMIQNISETTAQLEAALELANVASKAKDDFLARMSHEIRTPMNAVIGMTELALREEMSVSAREHVITAKQAGVNMLAIINDILDFSKIESGDLVIAPVEYSMSSLINDVISIIRMRVVDSNIQFAVNLDSNLPNTLIGDETRIRQVLINLLGNAVKYTDEGYVLFRVSGEMVSENQLDLKMEIEDSGLGIKPEHFNNLFDSYYQAGSPSVKGVEGVGLGLSITRSIVNAMDGEITVESEFGKGSTFTVTLPQKLDKFEMLAVVESPITFSVLVYEYRKVYAESIVYSIHNLGVKCDLTNNKAEFQSRIANGSYSFVFLSHDLFEQSRESILQYCDRFKIVLLTEFGHNIPSGDWSILSMPIHTITIANLFNGVLDNFSYSTTTDLTARFIAPDARILVVDDIKTNLKVANGLLSPYRMQVDLCDGGLEAIKAVKAADYDLVFMDHRMPEVDGIEATECIRAMGADNPYYASLPIIALTANAVSGMKETFLEKGFSDFIPKPIDTVKLNTILEQWIPKDKQKNNAAETSESDGNGTLKIIEVDGLNTAKGLRLSNQDLELYYKTLEVFCDDGNEQTGNIRLSLESRNLELYTIYVHALKSAAANIGADQLSDMALELEAAGQRSDLFYIEAYNETFLSSLEFLITGIKTALPLRRGYSDSVLSEDTQIAPQFSTELAYLKVALSGLSIRAVDNSIDALMKAAQTDREKAAAKTLSKHVLMGEYDEAAELISRLLSEPE